MTEEKGEVKITEKEITKVALGMFGFIPKKYREKAEGDIFDEIMLRETGLQRTIRKNDKIITALNDPGKYLTDKNNAIKGLGGKLSEFYDGEVSRYYDLGYSLPEARDKAKHFLVNEKARLLAEVEKDFPTDIENMARKRLMKEKGGSITK